MSKFKIIPNKEVRDTTKALTNAAKLYLGFALLALLLTLPTKAIFMLISFLWNCFG